MLDFLPEALVMGEAPAYAAGVDEPGAIVSDLGEHPGADLDAEAGEAEDDLSVRVLRESFFDRLGQVVGSDAGCLELDQEREHLLAERVLDQRWLVGPSRSGRPLGALWPRLRCRAGGWLASEPPAAACALAARLASVSELP
jgi:hypothetical protein